MRRALLAAVLVLLVQPASSTAASPRAVDFEQAVPAGRFAAPEGARAASRAWRSTAALRAPRRFDLLGVRGSAPAELQLRVRRASGRWSRWATLHAGEPAWTGAATTYQLRASGDPGGLRMHFVAIDGRAPVHAVAAAGRPAIVPRAAWDPGNQCPPRDVPSYGRVDLAMVHHTVSLNAYGPQDTSAIVLGVCRFHRNGNKWDDIGYNLLVDRYGVVYEGRGGGAREPVVGAQAQGWNSVSTGVAAIGQFSSGGLPSGALHALARVLAWKLTLAGVPASGSVVETSIGGELNRYPPDVRVRFQRISGHRDGDLTECPGAGLMAQLPALRALVADLMPEPRDRLTISPAPGAWPAGGPVLLTGRLARADGSRPSREPIALQQRVDGAWVDVASATTGGDGIWSAALALDQDADVRALHAPGGIASVAIPVSVRAGVQLRATQRTVRLGSAVGLTGVTTPPKARVRVLVQRRVGTRRYRTIRVRSVRAVEGRFSLLLRPPSAGVYRVRATTASDDVNAGGRARSVTVRVS